MRIWLIKHLHNLAFIYFLIWYKIMIINFVLLGYIFWLNTKNGLFLSETFYFNVIYATMLLLAFDNL